MKKFLIFTVIVFLFPLITFGEKSDFKTDKIVNDLDRGAMTILDGNKENLNFGNGICSIPDPDFNRPYDGCFDEYSSSPAFLNGIVLATSRIAEDFELSAASTVNQIAFTGEPPSAEDNFTVTYYLDNGNLPSTIHAGPFFVNVVSCPNMMNNSFFDFKASHPPVDFNAGQTYWVSIFNNLSGNTELRSQSWGWAGTAAAPNNIPGFAANNNGTNIYEPVVPAIGCSTNVAFSLGQSNAAIPTLSQWGIMALSMIMLIFGLVFLRRRKLVVG